MPAGTDTRSECPATADETRDRQIRCCESAPGTSVLIESGNTDGWIASDLTVDVHR